METLILWNVHRGATRRSAAIATAVTSWDYFVKHVCQITDPAAPVAVPPNVSWREVTAVAPGILSA